MRNSQRGVHSSNNKAGLERCIWPERGLHTQFAFRESALSVFNYLRQPDGAAECDGDSNVVTHPEVDCMDAASHVDLLKQGCTLIHRAEEDNERKVSN